jgi:hypothetical protein
LESVGPVNPNPFGNWGDWLIRRATGALGDFRMQNLISIIRTERHSRGWFDQFTDDDIRRVIARYKEHVKFWNVPPEVVQFELAQFAVEVGRLPAAIYAEYERLPAQRLPPDFRDGSPIPRR